MKKTLILYALTALLFVQCGKESDPFLIKDNAIGNLTNRTKMKQLDSIFKMDSIVKIHSSPNALETQGEVEIYEKGGQELLLLSPENETDPNSTITDVMIFDPRYKTEKGLNIKSTYKDFKTNYTVSDMQRITNGVLVSFSDSDIYLLIDSKYLTGEVKNDRNAKLEPHHIIDAATIKYFRLSWAPEL